MKKICSLALAFLMITVLFCGCGDEGKLPEKKEDQGVDAKDEFIALSEGYWRSEEKHNYISMRDGLVSTNRYVQSNGTARGGDIVRVRKKDDTYTVRIKYYEVIMYTGQVLEDEIIEDIKIRSEDNFEKSFTLYTDDEEITYTRKK